MSEALDALKTELLQRMDEHSAALKKTIRDAQTEILRAIFAAQESNRARLGDLEHHRAEAYHDYTMDDLDRDMAANRSALR